MQVNSSNPYAALQESDDQQRARYPVLPPVNGQQVPLPSYYMPIQPNGPMMYPVYLPQVPSGQIPQGQPINAQGIPQSPMYFLSAPLVAEPIDNSPTLIELIKNSTPEFFYKSLLRFVVAMSFTIFFSMIWLSGRGYMRSSTFNGLFINLIINVFVAVSGLRALKHKKLNRFKRHRKITFAFYAISIYRLIYEMVMWGIGWSSLINLLFFLQTGYLCCKSKKLLRQLKTEWNNDNNQQADGEAQNAQ